MAKVTATRSERGRRWLAAAWCLTTLFASPASAHDMWIAPERFELGRGERLRARLLVGEALVSEHSKPYVADRTSALAVHDRRGTVDLRESLREGADPLLSGQRLRGRGEHLVAMKRDWAFISLPVDRFVEYLAQEGIADVLDGRPALSGEQRERYRRSIKSLVRVGRGRGGRLHVRALGQPLEIVLLDSPARMGAGGSLRARLLLHGRALANHPLTAHVRDATGTVTTVRERTDSRGVVIFPGREGTWLLRSVHMSACHGCSDAQWLSEMDRVHVPGGT